MKRVVRWSGVRVDGGGGVPAGDVSLVGDSYGTMDWGLGSTEIRAYAAGGIIVFALARTDARSTARSPGSRSRRRPAGRLLGSPPTSIAW